MPLLFGSLAQASVIIQTTRVIFPASEKETTVQLTNTGTTPSLVQAWLDKGQQQETPDSIEVPFVITPTLFRMEPGKGQAVRILYSGEALPTDRESLFWLNVLDAAPKAEVQQGAGSLQFTFRTRIKLMYRPTGLAGSAMEAPSQLQWTLGTDASRQPVLRARNTTAFVINLSRVSLKAGGKTVEAGGGHVLPGETTALALKDPAAAADMAGATVVYSSINDWGGTQDHEAPLAP